MSNKIIYPILIIIFSILIIYGIISNKNNSKLNTNFENFENNFESKYKEILKSSVVNNTLFTTKMINYINGNWTTSNTTVDSNYVASNLMKIDIKSPSSPSMVGNNLNDYGTINLGSGSAAGPMVFRINFILNDNLTAVMLDPVTNTPTLYNLHIKFYNNFNKSDEENINPPFNNPHEFNAVVSLFQNNTLYTKFVSYKIYNSDNKVGDEVYRIIKAGTYKINKAPPIYDYATYNTILKNYKFTNNYLTAIFGRTNATILNRLSTRYQQGLKLCIKRVFYSPTNDNTEIISSSSPEIILNVISSNRIPTSLRICSFLDDKIHNNLDAFFKPKATILYFYKYVASDTTYKFASSDITQPNTVLNIGNNASSITENTIVFNNLLSAQKGIQRNYSLTYIKRYNSNLNDPTIVNFSDLYNLL